MRWGEEKKIRIYAIPKTGVPFLVPYEYLDFFVSDKSFDGNLEITKSFPEIVIKPTKKFMKRNKGRVLVMAGFKPNPFIETKFFVDINQ